MVDFSKVSTGATSTQVDYDRILKQNCKKYGLKEREVSRSEPGNCFFDATFDQLKRLNLESELEKYKSAKGLREGLVDYMERNPTIKDKVCE